MQIGLVNAMIPTWKRAVIDRKSTLIEGHRIK
jgi:hypothetical protein